MLFCQLYYNLLLNEILYNGEDINRKYYLKKIEASTSFNTSQLL